MYNSVDDIKNEYSRLYLKHIEEFNDYREELYSKFPKLKEIENDIMNLKIEKAKLSFSNSDSTDIDKKIKSLEDEKNKFYKANNINNKFKINYLCEDCKDTGYIDGVKCHCFIDKEIEMLKNVSHFDVIAKNDTFENLNFNFYNQNIEVTDGLLYKEYMNTVISDLGKKILDIKTNPLNVFFTGLTGTGKTFLARCIGNSLLEKHKSVFYLSASDLVSSIYDNKLKEYIYITDVLIIDDLGSEYITDFSITQVFNVINKRLVERKSTIITSNLSFNELKKNYDDRITSRIYNEYYLVRLDGKDLRGIKNGIE